VEQKFICVMAGYDLKTEAVIRRFQEDLFKSGFVGRQTKDLPQHITLGVFDIERKEEIMSLTRKIAKEIKPFEVTFNHIGIFSGSEVFFIAPDTTHELLKLKECYENSYNWTPHSTVLIDNPENIYKAIQITTRNFSPFKGKLETIYVYEFWPVKPIISVPLIGEE